MHTPSVIMRSNVVPFMLIVRRVTIVVSPAVAYDLFNLPGCFPGGVLGGGGVDQTNGMLVAGLSSQILSRLRNAPPPVWSGVSLCVVQTSSRCTQFHRYLLVCMWSDLQFLVHLLRLFCFPLFGRYRCAPRSETIFRRFLDWLPVPSVFVVVFPQFVPCFRRFLAWGSHPSVRLRVSLDGRPRYFAPAL